MENKDKKSLIFALNNLLERKDYDEMILMAKNALNLFPNDSTFQKLLNKAQANYVNEKLNSSIIKQLEEKQDHVGLYMIYRKLLTVFPESPELKELLSDLLKNIETKHNREKELFYNNALERANDFFHLNYFIKANEICEEVLSYDPDNKNFLKLKKEIQKKIDKKVKIELNSYFEKSIPELQTQYGLNPHEFIVI